MRCYYVIVLTLTIITSNCLCQYFNYIDISIIKSGKSVIQQLADTVNNELEATHISIEEQNVTKLLEGTFENLLKLKVIEIQHCYLEEIERGAFKNLPNLLIVNLNFNVLKEIRRGVFQNLDITHLYLIGNKISIIEDYAFSNIKYLEMIDLSRNQIATLNPFVFKGTMYLKQINLSFNKIQTVPNSFFEEPFSNVVKGLESFIDMSDNYINSLEIGAFKGVYNIERLNLENNNLRQLDSEIFNDIHSIKVLNLENNYLTSLNYKLLNHLKSANEIALSGNPWNCEFLKTYESWCKKYEKDNTLSDYNVTECN